MLDDVNAVLDQQDSMNRKDAVARASRNLFERRCVAAHGADTRLGKPLGTLGVNSWHAISATEISIGVVKALGPPGADQGHVPTVESDPGACQGSLQVLGPDALRRGQYIDAKSGRDIEEHAASQKGWCLLGAELFEGSTGLGFGSIDAAIHQTVVTDVGKRIDVSADVTASDDDLVGGRTAIGPDHISVPTDQCHPKAGVIRRARHPREERLSQLNHPYATRDGRE